jgi:hypothetical protein
MLTHLQGISPSAGGTPCNFFFNFNFCWQKMLVCFFSVLVLLSALVEGLGVSRMRDFFYSLSEMDFGHIL